MAQTRTRRPRVLAAIRCYEFGAPERRMLDALRKVFGDDVALALDARRDPEIPAELRCARLTGAALQDWGMAAPADWGWLCGDFFHYALRDAFPGYDAYWLIEPDVVFHRIRPADFFAAAGRIEADFLVPNYSERPKSWPHYPGSFWHFDRVWGCLFPLTRLSGRAIDVLKAGRIAYGAAWKARAEAAAPEAEPPYANDEAFVASSILAAPDLTGADLVAAAPQFFPALEDELSRWVLFTYHRMILREALRDMPPGLLHPVREGAEVLARLSKTTSPWQIREIGFYSRQVRHRMNDAANREFAQIATRLLNSRHLR